MTPYENIRKDDVAVIIGKIFFRSYDLRKLKSIKKKRKYRKENRKSVFTLLKEKLIREKKRIK